MGVDRARERGGDERRAHRRLEIRLPVELRAEVDSQTGIVRTITHNVSTGGLYLELDRADFGPGDRLRVELTLPAAEGVSAYPGRATCEAQIVRLFELPGDDRSAIRRIGVAARFLDRLRLNY